MVVKKGKAKMAEGFDMLSLVDENLESLEREMTCGICQEYYSDPRILPCLHYYCKRCIVKLRGKKSSKKIVCPECRQEWAIDKDVEALPTADFVNRIHSVLHVLKAKQKACQECSSGNKVESYCPQCAVPICKDCVESHKKLKTFASHEVVSLQSKDKFSDLLKKQAVQHCPVHYDEPLVLYCFDCAKLVCRDCVFKDHKAHEFEFCKAAAIKERVEVDEKLESLSKILDKLKNSLQNVNSTKGAIQEQETSVVESINTSFNKLKAIVEQRRKTLLDEAKSDFAGKMKKLEIQEKVINSSCAEVQNTVDYTNRLIDRCSDNELMTMHEDVRKKLEQEVRRYDTARLKSMEPKAKADIGVEVKCVDEIQQLCQTKATIVRLVVDTSLETIISGATEVEVNEEAVVLLTTFQESSDGSVVRGEVKSRYDGAIVRCDVDQSGYNSYRIRFTPTVRGRHEVTVTIDGKEVKKSPYTVFASIQPTALGKLVHVWKGVDRASGVTISHEGDPVVSEYFGSIKLMKKDEQVAIVSRENARLNSLCGLATDDKGNIYCTDAETSSIMVFNSAENRVDTHSVPQQKGPGHWGITVSGNRIMVCECNNKGSVMVYNKKWKYQKSIEQGSGQFMDVSCDSSSNVYVTDYVNASILMFNKQLEFVRSFGSGGGRRGRELVKPYGLCVSGEYIYVSNWGGGHNVTIFTLEGKFISSFGRRGDKEGNFDSPCGVCVDKDGFVIVADYANNRVQIF